MASQWSLFIFVVSYTIFVLCQPDQHDKWLNQTKYFRPKPRWPEQFIEQHYPLYSLNYSHSHVPPKNRQPEWPEKVLQNNKAKKLQYHASRTSRTILPYGVRLTSKRKKEIALHKLNRRLAHHHEELHKKKNSPIEPRELYNKYSEHGKHRKADAGLGIGGDFSYERRSFDATDADFVSFLMVQADEMAEAMMELYATRRTPHYFTVHHTRCLGVNSYCREACLQVEENVCRRFKCSRQVKEYLTKQCQNCNLRVIRNFPRKLLLSLDFLKAREVYSAITNRTFESFYPPKYLRPFYSKKQPGAPRPEDFSYYTDESSEYYSYYTDEIAATNATKVTTEKATDVTNAATKVTTEGTTYVTDAATHDNAEGTTSVTHAATNVNAEGTTSVTHAATTANVEGTSSSFAF